MIFDQVSFEQALADAQRLGYAEQDPTADIDGADACRKLCILGSLAFGKQIYPEYVHCSGIRNITLDDVEYVANAGYAVKLIGLIEKTEKGLVATVCPRLVSVSNPLSGVNDVYNAIMIRGDSVGDTLFSGKVRASAPSSRRGQGEVTKNSIRAANTSYPIPGQRALYRSHPPKKQSPAFAQIPVFSSLTPQSVQTAPALCRCQMRLFRQSHGASKSLSRTDSRDNTPRLRGRRS